MAAAEAKNGLILNPGAPGWFRPAARHLYADDCSSECTGTFAGLRTTALVGYRWFFVGPELSVGSVNDEEHGSDFGVMWGVQGRFVFGWGR